MVGLSSLLKISLDHPEKRGIVENQHSKEKTCRDTALIEKPKVPAGSHNARRRERVFSAVAHEESCAQRADFFPFKAENLQEQPPKILQWVE